MLRALQGKGTANANYPREGLPDILYKGKEARVYERKGLRREEAV